MHKRKKIILLIIIVLGAMIAAAVCVKIKKTNALGAKFKGRRDQ